ncbi:MAG TPA: glycosyltransferase family 2 protein [Cyclobacteriaceae bacterium]
MLISIILPCYNCQDYIGQAIHSVLRQSYEDWELLIVDDGSTDRSPEIIQQYAATDARIRVITQPNGGVSRARNAALAEARGEYVALLDADDWLPQDSLLVRLRKFNESPDIAFVDGRVDIYNEAGNSIERSWVPTFRGNPCRMLLRLSPACFFGPTWMIRLRQGFEYKFDERLKYGEDLSAYLRLAQEGGKYDFVGETIYCYRDRAGSAMKNVDGLADGYLMLRKIFKTSNAFRLIDRLVFEYKIKRIMFLTYLRSGNIGKALRYLSR